MKKIKILVILMVLGSMVKAQELNSRVQILAPNISNINKQNLEVLQNTIRDFLNNNKWTNETYLAPERIECLSLIHI